MFTCFPDICQIHLFSVLFFLFLQSLLHLEKNGIVLNLVLMDFFFLVFYFYQNNKTGIL